ncbi:MAG TPA: MFS transporter [Tepidisphaeraceae bacterium]|jgi:ACS family tartrate transporter-like MFS transporter|nr:MFS transporter [Tepidisphaeraceae bacterium]
MHLDYATPPISASSADAKRTLRKIAFRLIPFLFLLYVVNYIDRANISFTKKPMQVDLNLSERAYGFAAGIFFLGYTLLEVPSNLALQRFGARRWIARIIISWGIVAACMTFVRGATSFSLLRLLLGAAEAGFMPGIILYLSQWFPARQQAKAFGLFLTSTALSGVVGSPLSAHVLKMDGMLHLHGWQWVFLLEGLACLPLGLLTLYWLPDKPTSARWLSPAQAKWVEAELEADAPAGHHDAGGFFHALRDRQVWLLTIPYFCIISGLFGFIFWAPSLITDHTGGWLTAVPYLVAAVMMVVIGRSSDLLNERRWHVVACAIIGAVGMAASALCPNTPLVIFTLSFAAIGIWGSLGPFWALPTAFLRGKRAAAGIAVVNSVGCTAGLVTPWVIGAIKQSTGGFSGLYFVTGTLMLGALSLCCMNLTGGEKKAPEMPPELS